MPRAKENSAKYVKLPKVYKQIDSITAEAILSSTAVL